jgi:hypothetical protein
MRKTKFFVSRRPNEKFEVELAQEINKTHLQTHSSDVEN